MLRPALLRPAKYWLFLLLLGTGACSDTVAPNGSSDSGFSFSPTATSQRVAAGEYLEFRVTHQPESDLGVRWWINGEPAGQGPRFRFVPATTRLDTLTADASRAGRSAQFTWYIDSMYNSPTAVTFTPDATVVDVVLGQSYDFEVNSSRAAATRYRWELGGEVLGETAGLIFAPTKAGLADLAVTVTTPDHEVSRTWQVRSYTPDNLPPAPPSVLQYHELEGVANLVVSWQQAIDRGLPITSYELAISYEGPLTNDNWDAAQVLLERPYLPGRVSYVDTLSAENGLLVPGAHAWLAATSVNGNGVRSMVSNNLEVDITEPWWVGGTVRDETGRVLAGVRIWDSGHYLSTVTGPDGRYRIGPFPNTRRIFLETVSSAAGDSWIDAKSDTLTIDTGRVWDFLLLTDAQLLAHCEAYEGSFINFLRDLTNTTHPTEHRQNLRLYKWSSYPVPVWIPEYTNEAGVDFSPLCHEAIRIWNTAMGEEILTVVADSAGAGISFRYGDDMPGFMGRAILIEDEFTGRELGDTIPINVELYLFKDLPNAQLATEVILHEMGHALGLYGHLACSDQGYLMDISPVGALDNGPEFAIHPDELRALRAIRDLPQGTDMGQFITRHLP